MRENQQTLNSASGCIISQGQVLSVFAATNIISAPTHSCCCLCSVGDVCLPAPLCSSCLPPPSFSRMFLTCHKRLPNMIGSFIGELHNSGCVVCWMLCRHMVLMKFQHECDLFMFVSQSYSDSRSIRWIQDLSSSSSFPPALFLFFSSWVVIPAADQQMASFPHQTTAQLHLDWSAFKNTKLKRGALFSLQLRLCLKTLRCFTVEGFFFPPHTHIWVCLLFRLTTSPISHLGSPLTSLGDSQLRLHEKSFPCNQLYLWMWRHAHMYLPHVRKPKHAKIPVLVLRVWFFVHISI